MNTHTTKKLIHYNAWANKLTFDAVARLAPTEAVKARKTLFKNIVHTLNHNYVIDLIWKAHLEGYDHGFNERNTKESPPLNELWHLQQEIDAWYTAYVNKLSSEQLNEKIQFKLIGGNKGIMTRGEILLHVVNHTTYHRGFIADMFYQIPSKPPTTDLPVFFSEGDWQ